jgi:hypothetical protein
VLTSHIQWIPIGNQAETVTDWISKSWFQKLWNFLLN